jgi:hypothetical protein
LIDAISHSGTLERIPPGASVSMGNPVPCSVYQIFASPLSTYGTRVSSRLRFRCPAYRRAARAGVERPEVTTVRSVKSFEFF